MAGLPKRTHCPIPSVLTVRKKRLRVIELVAQNQPAGKSRGVMPVPSRMLPKVDAPDPSSVNSSLVEGEQLTLSVPEAVLRLSKGMHRADFLP